MNNAKSSIYISPNIPPHILNIDLKIRENAFGEGQKEKTPDILFTLEKNCEIVAVGNLRKLHLEIGQKNISIHGLGGVVSVQKKKGYGRLLLEEIKNYIHYNNIVTVGICKKSNSEFYKKCGFEIIPNLASRIFVNSSMNPDGDEDVLLYPKSDIFDTIKQDNSLHINAPFWW